MDRYILLLALVGVLVLLTAWLPMALKEAPLSLPIVCVGLGLVGFRLLGDPGFAPHPGEYPAIVND